MKDEWLRRSDRVRSPKMFQGFSNVLTSSKIRKIQPQPFEQTVVNYNKNGEIIYVSYRVSCI
jgi:hypothetical protein